ncbi:MAG: glycosyltransferase family 2 protein [Bacteroidales bacterium]|jgi:glycosyltransferase involved in cell wall biosynthesis|nr:glycosyltransferase family 2 protein [Bacteroidales bacterium]
MDISIIIPLLDEAESLSELAAWIDRVMKNHPYSYEVIMIDDGSRDSSWSVIKEIAQKSPHVHAIRFRRNYGKSAALYCGFKQATGDVVITMDADLQDSPDEIPELYRMIRDEEYDLVSGWKKKRFDSKLTKNFPSKIYNATARCMTGIRLHDMNCGIKAYRNDVVKNIEVYGEMHRYIPVLAYKAGFTRIGEKVVEHRARRFGVSKFGWTRFINGFLDLLSILFVSRFGKKPMHLFGLLGTLIFIVGFLSSAGLGIQKLHALHQGLKMDLVTNSPYFYFSLVSMVLGTQLFLAGFLGELISRNSIERNTYQIKEEL